MEQHLEHLLTLAEILITLIGFSALISVIGTTQSIAHTSVDKFRILIMIQAGLCNVAAAVLPLILAKFWSAAIVWKVSAGALLIADVAYTIWTARRIRRMYKLLTLMDKAITAIAYTLTVAVYVVLVFVVFDIVEGYGAAGFFVALYLNGLLLGLVFIGIATSILMPGITEGENGN